MASFLDQALAGTQPAPHSLPALPDPRGGFQTRTRLALLLRGDDSLWHERIVLGRLDKDSYACLTPDLEISQELLSFSNPEIKGIRVMRGSGGYLGVDPGELFSFDAAGTVLSDADIADWVQEAGALIQAMGSGRVDPSVPASGEPSGAAGPGGGLVADALLAASKQDEREVWLAAETIGNTVVGSIVKPDSNTRTLPGSDRAIHQRPGGAYICLRRRVLKEERSREKDGVSADAQRDELAVLPEGRVDSRTLNLAFDVRGARHLEFYNGIQLCRTNRGNDWPILGPMTVLWLLLYMHRNGGAPTAFHQRWLAEVRLDYGAAGVAEHLGLCKMFEIALVYDQLDLCANASFELGARRIQAIHDKWKHKLPSQSGLGATGATGLDDDMHLLLGTSETRGNLGVAPELQRWLADESSKEANAAKERRKAREERALASKGKP